MPWVLFFIEKIVKLQDRKFKLKLKLNYNKNLTINFKICPTSYKNILQIFSFLLNSTYA